MKENQFIVDLGKMKLTDPERQRINATIQKAVAGELASMNAVAKGRVVMIPVNPKIKIPIWWGYIIRDVTEPVIKEIANIQPLR